MNSDFDGAQFRNDHRVLRAVELVGIARLRPMLKEAAERVVLFVKTGGLLDSTDTTELGSDTTSPQLDDIALAGVVALANFNSDNHVRGLIPRWDDQGDGQDGPEHDEQDPEQFLPSGEWLEWHGPWSDLRDWVGHHQDEWKGWLTTASQIADADAPRKPDGEGGEVTPVYKPPDEPDLALTKNQIVVLATMGRFDGLRLLSMAAIEEEMHERERLSERTIGPIVSELIELDLAERPKGKRSGARLKRSGRMLAQKIAD